MFAPCRSATLCSRGRGRDGGGESGREEAEVKKKGLNAWTIVDAGRYRLVSGGVLDSDDDCTDAAGGVRN